MQHLKLDPKDDSIIVSHDRAANNADGSVSQTKPRPKSAVDTLSHNQADSDLDDFYDPSNFSSLASPRRAWKASVSLHSADTSTQTTETRGNYFPIDFLCNTVETRIKEPIFIETMRLKFH